MKLENTIKTLEWVSDNILNVAKASSFSAEDAVITDIMVKINPDFKFFTIDTGRLPKETFEIMKATEKKYGIKFEVIKPDEKEVGYMVLQYGKDLFRDSVFKRKHCCLLRKVRPLEKKLKGLNGWITGLRREQTGRENTQRFQMDRGTLKINPIVDWTWDEVYDYVRDNSLPFQEICGYVYDKRNVNCEPCIRNSVKWWWETNGDKECGMHL